MFGAVPGPVCDRVFGNGVCVRPMGSIDADNCRTTFASVPRCRASRAGMSPASALFAQRLHRRAAVAAAVAG